MVQESPYNDKFVVPPGGRADIEIICFYEGIYGVLATNSTENNGEPTTFQNAPVALKDTIIMKINVTGDDQTGDYGDITNCTQWLNDELGEYNQLQCDPQPYSTSNYLADTQNLLYPNVSSQCMSEYEASEMSRCNVVLQRKLVINEQVSFNGIQFSHDTAMFVIGTNKTHEFLVTSNFHPFHQVRHSIVLCKLYIGNRLIDK